jgi:hypothetical protein
MSKVHITAPHLACFLAGAAVIAVALPSRRSSHNWDHSPDDNSGKSGAARLATIEAQLREHADRLAELPSSAQIVAAIEQLLGKTMGSLDDRLSSQAGSIEVLRNTISQTGSLLERVLEALDSLQSADGSAELAEETPENRPAI